MFDQRCGGVAKEGFNLERLRARARESLQYHGGAIDRPAFDELSSLLRYVDGDYEDPATFDVLRPELSSALQPLHYLAIPPSLLSTVVGQLGRCPADADRINPGSWHKPLPSRQRTSLTTP